MPTPRRHGGAELQHLPLNLPGYMGLNTELRGSVLGPEWATRLSNTVLDDANRIASRKGWSQANGAALTGNIVQLHEHLDEVVGNTIWATTDDNQIWRSTDNAATFTLATGSASVSDPNMQIVSFRDSVVGFQEGALPISFGTNSVNLSVPGAPQHGIALSAFGRLWAKDGPTVIKYSALLSQSDWTGSDTGVLDMTSIWPSADVITAIYAFSGNLVVFSKRHIVLFNDTDGSPLGLDPANAAVVDMISGIGCVARDSVQNVKGDLWFLDDTGVHSLGRLVNTESNPIINLTKHIQSEIQDTAEASDLSKVRSVYSTADKFYLLSFPSNAGGLEVGKAYCLDTRTFMQDGSVRVPGVWNSLVPTAVIRGDNLEMYMAIHEAAGHVGTHNTYLDDGRPYVMEYESGWTDLGSPDIKVLKRIEGLLFISDTVDVTYRWSFDFRATFFSAIAEYENATGVGSLYGSARFGTAHWGGGVTLQEQHVAGKSQGEHVKIGMSVNIDGSGLACQQISLYAKPGRLS